MRLTVLCLLAFAGATCALQIPSILSPQSALDAGSSILDKVPGINQKADDSSSSSSGSSSEEGQGTPQIATELAERLVNDVLNVGGGLGSAALLPLKVGASLFNTLNKEISNFVGEVLNPENLKPGDPTVPELAVDLTRSVARDIEKVARNIGSLLLEPEKLKLQLIQTIASDVEQWIKKTQNQLSGQSSRPKKQGA